MDPPDALSFAGNNESSHVSFDQAWTDYRTRHCGEPPSLSSLPKVDLHCHLNGSISAPLLHHMECIQQRVREKSGVCTQKTEEKNDEKNISGRSLECMDSILEHFSDPADRMKYCFGVFDNIYKIMTNAAFTRMAVQDLLIHSAAEYLCILEIRTSLREGLYETPQAALRGHEADCISKKEYLETVIHTVEHLMNGGVVDFETGALLPPNASIPATWWSYFSKLYSSIIINSNEAMRLLPNGSHHEENVEKGTDGGVSVAQDVAEQFWRRIRDHMMCRMHVHLLVSINRGHSPEAARETVTLAKQIQREQVQKFFSSSMHTEPVTAQEKKSSREKIRRTCWITGLDFSGYCAKNHFIDFVPALTEARRVSDVRHYPSLGITLHAGEKDDANELAEMVKFYPERWGHLVYTDVKNLSTIIARHDAIELCITSNAVTGGYKDVAQHHMTGMVEIQWGGKNEVNKTEKNEEKECHQVDPELLKPLIHESSLSVAMQCRVQRRLARWCKLSAIASEETVIPNVSFHTDDRGVFFTSVTKELELLLQHGFLENEAVMLSGLSIKAIWALERLSLPHVFEIPLEVVYSTVCAWRDCCHRCSRDHIAEHMSAHVASLSEVARAKLSSIELGWLLRDFDAF